MAEMGFNSAFKWLNMNKLRIIIKNVLVEVGK